MSMDLIEKSVLELRVIAKDLGLENISKLKKSELILKIEEAREKANGKTDENGVEVQENDIVDGQGRYNLTSDTDKYVEGILELLPDGYG